MASWEGLASHWPCITDNSGTITYGLMKGDEHTAYTPVEYSTLYTLLYV